MKSSDKVGENMAISPQTMLFFAGIPIKNRGLLRMKQCFFSQLSVATFQRDAGIIRGSVGRRLELPRPKEWQSDRGPKPDFVRFGILAC